MTEAVVEHVLPRDRFVQPSAGSADLRRKVVIMPAKPARKLHSMKQNSFTRRVSIPMSSAA